MTQCKVTVLRKTINQELAKQYCGDKVTLCPCFEVGQEFTCGLGKPENLCDWAWHDIHPMVAVILTGGNFSRGVFDGWMKDDRTMIGCCTDGVRPVVFRIEKIEE